MMPKKTCVLSISGKMHCLAIRRRRKILACRLMIAKRHLLLGSDGKRLSIADTEVTVTIGSSIYLFAVHFREIGTGMFEASKRVPIFDRGGGGGGGLYL